MREITRRIKGKMSLGKVLMKAAAAALPQPQRPGGSVDAYVTGLVNQRKFAARANKATGGATTPAAVMKAMKTKKGRSKAMKAMEPRGDLPRPKPCPAQPKEGHPIDYCGGRMYLKGGFFRTIRAAGNYGTERKVRIESYASKDQAFYAALKCVRDWHGL